MSPKTQTLALIFLQCPHVFHSIIIFDSGEREKTVPWKKIWKKKEKLTCAKPSWLAQGLEGTKNRKPISATSIQNFALVSAGLLWPLVPSFAGAINLPSYRPFCRIQGAVLVENVCWAFLGWFIGNLCMKIKYHTLVSIFTLTNFILFYFKNWIHLKFLKLYFPPIIYYNIVIWVLKLFRM